MLPRVRITNFRKLQSYLANVTTGRGAKQIDSARQILDVRPHSVQTLIGELFSGRFV